ncbi:hypothetical protein COU91_02015 [Candidatus Saccharibacteria bacterium CG10_big_fil_rev_8_21_14_0_10_47_8]|nr:MAG: hypothetical protein COU91_02015 [Candidatus Saccharibacteria bacterium CG10_big_fil_rev_8_21_14_0_10_47_8]
MAKDKGKKEKKKPKKQQGFTLVEGLLILVIVGVLGFVGWYVWHAKNNTEKTLQDTVQSQGTVSKIAKKPSSTLQKTDPTADWTAYSDKAGNFSLKYPKSWVTATNPELCSEGILLLGANTASVGKCASEGFGQIAVTSNEGDYSSDSNFSSGYVQVTKSSVTVDSVAGVKESGIASGQEAGLGSLDDGVKVVEYTFYTNGKTYKATYTQEPSYPDALSDFNLMVTQTLKFHS